MSDFLSRLMDRALGEAPALNRRIPSLFERTPDPALRWGDGETRSDLHEEETVSDQSSSGIEPRRATAAPTAHPVMSRRGARVEPARPAAAEEAGGLEPIRAYALAPPAAGPVRRAGPVAGPDKTATPPARPDRHGAEPVSVPPLGKHPIVEEVPAAGAVAPAVARADKQTDLPRAGPRQPVPEPAPRPLVRHRDSRARAPRAAGPLPLVASIRAALAPAVSAPPSPQPRSPLPPALVPESHRESPPAIQVTIGRIEVRAVPVPSGPSIHTSRPAGPRLTLEEYLRSRDEGPR